MAGATNSSGNALLAAVGAWLVGVDVAVCSLVGQSPPDTFLQELTRMGIDVTRVRRASAREAVSGHLQPTPDQLDSVGRGWSVHLCQMSPTRQHEIIRALWQRVALVTVASAYLGEGTTTYRAQVIELAGECGAIVLGRRDLEEVWPGKSPRDVLRRLARRGAHTAVMRLGAGAAIGIRNNVLTWMPAFTSGAEAVTRGGDAYAAAFAAAFTSDRDLRRAMAWAGAAASAVVESRAPLELLNAYARRTVASRAELLESQSLDGWRPSSGSSS